MATENTSTITHLKLKHPTTEYMRGEMTDLYQLATAARMLYDNGGDIERHTADYLLMMVESKLEHFVEWFTGLVDQENEEFVAYVQTHGVDAGLAKVASERRC